MTNLEQDSITSSTNSAKAYWDNLIDVIKLWLRSIWLTRKKRISIWELFVWTMLLWTIFWLTTFIIGSFSIQESSTQNWIVNSILLIALVIRFFLNVWLLVKRQHDLWKPWYHLFLMLIPFYNIYYLLILFFTHSKIESNKYWESPLNNQSITNKRYWIVFILLLAINIWLNFLP